LQEILKKTQEGHPDRLNLEASLARIERVIVIVNDGARQAEGVHRMLEIVNSFTEVRENNLLSDVFGRLLTLGGVQKLPIIAPTRRLVKEGQLCDVDITEDGTVMRQLSIFLFNDLLIFAKKKREKLQVIDVAPLSEILLCSPKKQSNSGTSQIVLPRRVLRI
jgi:hypothetical protein